MVRFDLARRFTGILPRSARLPVEFLAFVAQRRMFAFMPTTATHQGLRLVATLTVAPGLFTSLRAEAGPVRPVLPASIHPQITEFA